MKRLLSFALAAAMALSLVACGSDPVTLAPKTINGLSIDIPSDFGAFTEQTSGAIATNEDTTGNISVSVAEDAGGLTPADLDQDTYQQMALADATDVQFETYDNAADCNGIPAIFVKCTMKNANDVAVTMYAYILFHEDGTLQSVHIAYNSDTDNSVKANIDAITKSIKLA